MALSKYRASGDWSRLRLACYRMNSGRASYILTVTQGLGVQQRDQDVAWGLVEAPAGCEDLWTPSGCLWASLDAYGWDAGLREAPPR